MNGSSDNWDLTQNNASLTGARFLAEVKLDDPEEGVSICREQGKSKVSVLGYTHLPSVVQEKVDQYIRGEDLVATFNAEIRGSDNLQFRDQVYWRYYSLERNKISDGIELLASVQTDLLDLSPRVQIRSEFQGGELFVINSQQQTCTLHQVTESQTFNGPSNSSETESAFLFKSDEGWSYLQCLHDTDFHSCEKTEYDFSDGKLTVVVTLHFDHLEKGVIRRLRVRGGMSDETDPPLEDIQKWLEAFSVSEIPLTV